MLITKIKNTMIMGLACLSLSACAGPPAMQIISLAADGISWLATDKTITDHGLSVVVQKDCKMMRTLKGEDICVDVEEELIAEEADVEVSSSTSLAPTE